MRICKSTRTFPSVALLLLGPVVIAGEPFVHESAREIPLAYQVDVVVIGGSTGAVSAAVAAAESGASVFLAAPRPYLGDDMAATLRLWRDEKQPLQTPLARRLFHDPKSGDNRRHPNRIPITYRADRPSSPKHRDTDDSPKLIDGQWGNHITHSVQYDGSVNLMLDLNESQAITQIRLMAHHRDDGTTSVKYKIDKVEVSVSEDRKTWDRVAATTRKQTERSYVMTIPVDVRARYVKLSLVKSPDAGRILVSEVEVIGPKPRSSDDTTPRMLRPMHVKKVLDKALLDAGVQFLYGCFPTDVLRDADGMPCGIVMANRSGRQAVAAKSIIDATDWAVVARMAGARFRSQSAGARTFKRVVIGGEIRRDSPIGHRVVGTIEGGGRSKVGGYPVVEYTFDLEVGDATWKSWAEAEQRARDMTYQPGQVRASEKLSCVPWVCVVSRAETTKWKGFENMVLDVFRPADATRLFVLGACADIPREDAEQLLDAPVLMKVGSLIGEAAAKEAATLPVPKDPRLPAEHIVAAQAADAHGDVREALLGVRPTQRQPTLSAGPRRVPVLGSYDVVVIGGGTSGAPAGIAAARQGTRVLVVEYQEGLGGIGTLGLIGRPHRGMDIGFTREVPFPDAKHGIEHKMEWYRREIRKAGGEIWLGALGCGAFVDGNRMKGAVVATPMRRGVVLAKVVIDATGNADVASAAGAETMYGDETGDIALQGTGLPKRPLGASYVNSDYLLVEEADRVDVWAALTGTRLAMDDATYDAGTLIQNRERRRIAGDHVLRYLDQVIGRTYPDTIVLSTSNYDSHGYTSGPFFALLPQNEESRTATHSAPGGSCYTPYRCLLPKGLDGILVVGTGMSMERDASAMVRMQRDLQNQGYAAGVAAAMIAKENQSTREIDVKVLQKHLVSVGNLPEEVLQHRDNFPLTTAEIFSAVKTVVDPDRIKAAKALAVILAHREIALPLLKEAHAASDGPARLTYAKILGFFSQTEVVPELIAALRAVPAWDAKILQGVAAEYAHLPTPVDALVLALGYTGDRRAVPPILEKLELLDADAALSHHRAVALALERIGDRAATVPLADLLAKPGMRGHAMRRLEPLFSDRDKRRREGALREIVLARALYRCGDSAGLGERILGEYQQDLRGLFARHSGMVLESAGLKNPPTR